MKYINTLSKEGLVNIFADYIIKNINPIHKSRFQVIDFKSFLVVYGSTSSDVIIDLNKLRDEFIKENKKLFDFLNLKSLSIIDLIDYREPISPNQYYFTYYKSDRPIYHKEVIKEVNRQTSEYNKEFLNNISYTNKLELEFYSPFLPDKLNVFNSTNFMSVSSSFPYGYSLNLGRREFYYGEYVCNHLFDILVTDEILFKYTTDVVEDDLNIDIICDSIYSHKDIKSLVLDVFDFNLNKFSNEYLNEFNIDSDIKNQLDSKPWLVKDRIKDLILF